MIDKFTDEEMSRILGEHAAGFLVSCGGGPECDYVCIIQAATGDPSCLDAMRRDEGLAITFDNSYRTNWSEEDLLHFVEERGKF